MRLRYLLCVIGALLVSGCSNISGTRVAPDGGQLTLRVQRFLWRSDGVAFDLTDANGVHVGLSVEKSGADSEALRAIAEGAAKGAVEGAK